MRQIKEFTTNKNEYLNKYKHRHNKYKRILRKIQTSTAQIRKNPEINITITIRWKISDENTNNTTKNKKKYQDECKNLPTIKKKFWDKYNKYKLRVTQLLTSHHHHKEERL